MEESDHSSEGSNELFKPGEGGWRAFKKQRRNSYASDGFTEASQGNGYQNNYNISTPTTQKELSYRGEDFHICNGFFSNSCCTYLRTPRKAAHNSKAFECKMTEDDYNICKTSPRTLIQSLQEQSSFSDDSEVEESHRHDNYENGKWSVRDNPIASDDTYHEHDELAVSKKYSWTAIRGRVLFKSPENAAQQEIKEEEGEHDLLDNCSVEISDCISSTSSNILQPGTTDTMLKEHLLNIKLQVPSSMSSEFRETAGILQFVKCRAWNCMGVIFRKPMWVSLFLPVALVAIKLSNMHHEEYHVRVPT